MEGKEHGKSKTFVLHKEVYIPNLSTVKTRALTDAARIDSVLLIAATGYTRWVYQTFLIAALVPLSSHANSTWSAAALFYKIGNIAVA